MEIEIITPAETFPPLEAGALDVPAVSGRMALLPGHQPLVCALEQGRTILECSKGRAVWETGAGTLMVHEDKVTLLVKSAKQP